MPLKTPISQHLIDVKFRVLKSLLLISAIAMALIAIVNFANQRPVSNTVLPLAAGLIFWSARHLCIRLKFRNLIRLGYMIFLVNIYLPVAWVTSPGSFSAMSFYALLILFIGIILSERYVENAIPLVGLVEMLGLFFYETLHPEQYNLYVPLDIRALDLSIHFTIAVFVIFVVSMTLNRHFDDEHQKLFKISITDQLTKVYNRRYLFQRLEEVHYHAQKSGAPFSLLMIDINHFKLVNDTYGHNAGDEVLAALGNILITCSRKQDTPARFGGDEFVLLLPDTGYEQASLVASRIAEAFKPIADTYAETRLSLGIGITENHNLDIDEMIQVADDHLYKNKRDMKADEAKNEGKA